LVTHSVNSTNTPNMAIAVQLVACLVAWPRSPPAAYTTPLTAAPINAEATTAS